MLSRLTYAVVAFVHDQLMGRLESFTYARMPTWWRNRVYGKPPTTPVRDTELFLAMTLVMGTVGAMGGFVAANLLFADIPRTLLITAWTAATTAIATWLFAWLLFPIFRTITVTFEEGCTRISLFMFAYRDWLCKLLYGLIPLGLLAAHEEDALVHDPPIIAWSRAHFIETRWEFDILLALVTALAAWLVTRPILYFKKRSIPLPRIIRYYRPAWARKRAIFEKIERMNAERTTPMTESECQALAAQLNADWDLQRASWVKGEYHVYLETIERREREKREREEQERQRIERERQERERQEQEQRSREAKERADREFARYYDWRFWNKYKALYRSSEYWEGVIKVIVDGGSEREKFFELAEAAAARLLMRGSGEDENSITMLAAAHTIEQLKTELHHHYPGHPFWEEIAQNPFLGPEIGPVDAYPLRMPNWPD
jgi:hypothetical protein